MRSSNGTSGEASMIFATGAVGELGISPRQAPLITQLKPGPVRVQQPDGNRLGRHDLQNFLEVTTLYRPQAIKCLLSRFLVSRYDHIDHDRQSSSRGRWRPCHPGGHR